MLHYLHPSVVALVTTCFGRPIAIKARVSLSCDQLGCQPFTGYRPTETGSNTIRKLIAWLAALAVLLAAIVPSISLALARSRSATPPWMEVCSYSATKQVKADGTQNSTPTTPAEKGSHFRLCPFCCTHGGPDALPSTAGFVLPIASNGQAHPSLYGHFPRPLFIWAAALPRAPPAF